MDQRQNNGASPGESVPPASGPASWIRAGSGDRATVVSGCLAFFLTVLGHAGIWWLAPEELPRKTPEARFSEFRRELQIVLPSEEPPEEPDRFVVTNPAAPSNPPDEASHFAARDQQAAQPEPPEEETGSPAVEGEFEEPTQAIVAEEALSPQEMTELAESLLNPVPLPPTVSARPVPGFEETVETEGLEIPVASEARPVETDGIIEVPVKINPRDQPMELAEAPPVQPEETVSPRPRPRVSRISSDPVGVRRGGTNQIGTLAVDAKFSEFGDYLTRMIEAVSRQWHILAWNSLPSAEVGTLVVVRFQIDSEGRVHDVRVEHSTAGLTATLICQDAITSRQPYGEWPSDMRSVLGEVQTIGIRFFYR